MTHLLLFRVRSWNNGMRCMSLYILIELFINIFSWTSYQIRKIAGCACAGQAGNVSSAIAVTYCSKHECYFVTFSVLHFHLFFDFNVLYLIVTLMDFLYQFNLRLHNFSGFFNVNRKFFQKLFWGKSDESRLSHSTSPGCGVVNESSKHWAVGGDKHPVIVLCTIVMGKFDWEVWYVIIFLSVQCWIRLAAVSHRGKNRTVASPAVRSVNKSRDKQICFRNEPQYAICVVFTTRFYYRAMKIDFVQPDMANYLQLQSSWWWPQWQAKSPQDGSAGDHGDNPWTFLNHVIV